MLPPAPPRLSTMNCCGNAWLKALAVARARMSVVPPGANGTTIFTGLVGQPDCAPAGRAAAPAAKASSERRERKGWLMMSPWVVVASAAPSKRPPAGGRSAGCPTASVGVDAGCLDDGAPLRDLGGHELLVLGLLRALVGDDHGAQAFLLLDEIGILQGDLQRVIQLLLDLRRGALGRVQAVPDRH